MAATPLSSRSLVFFADGDLSGHLRQRLDPNQQALLQLVQPAGDLKTCPQADWAAVEALASRLGLLERLGSRAEELASAGVPPEWIERWAGVRRARAACNLLLAREEADLLRAFLDCGIEAVPLKGVSLARILHQDVSLRPVADIDLGIRSCQVARAAGVLEHRGYAVPLPRALLGDPAFLRAAGEHTAEAVCVGERAGFSVLVELHWKILPLPEDLIWSSLVEYGDSGASEPSARTLAPELYLLFLCAHVSGHGWISLRWLCDVAEFLVRLGPRIDPERFLRHCVEARLRRRVGVTFELLAAYFGLRWKPMDELRNFHTRHTAAKFLFRPFTPALGLRLRAEHRERLQLLDNASERLRYLWWLAQPTRTELLRGKGALRSRPWAWLLRAGRLTQRAWEGSFSGGAKETTEGPPFSEGKLSDEITRVCSR